MQPSTSQLEGLAAVEQRISAKLSSASYRKDLFTYLLVEELLVQSEAAGVFIDIAGPARSESDSNLLVSEQQALLNAFESQQTRRRDVFAAGARSEQGVDFESHCTLTILDKPTAHIPNDNLQNLDAELRLSVTAADHRLTAILWFHSAQNTDGIITATVGGSQKAPADFLSALQRVLQNGLSATEDAAADHDFVSDGDPLGQNFIQQKEDFFVRAAHLDKESFVEAYARRFRPLEIITRRVDIAIRNRLRRLDSGYSQLPLIFSFRSVGEGQISFYLGSEQLKQLLDAPVGPFSIAEVRDLLQFVFKETVGLSGYVLATGHSDFTPLPRVDARWLKDTTGQHQTLPLIDRMYRILAGADDVTGNVNVLLLPLFAHSEIRGIGRNRNMIQLLVECSLPADSVSRKRLRQELVDLQWDYMPLVETAIMAQQQTQLQANAETIRFITAHAWTLGHNFPKFLSKPIINIAKQLENISMSLHRELNAQLTEEQGKKLTQIRNVVSYLPFMAGHYSEFFTFFVSSLPGPRSSRQALETAPDKFDPPKFKAKLHQFLSHYRELLAGTNRRAEGCAPSEEYSKMDLHWDASRLSQSSAFYYNDALLLELIINHVANSMDELARDDGALIAADSARAEIRVGLDLDTRSSQRSDVGFLIVTIADRGPGMAADFMRELRAKLGSSPKSVIAVEAF